MVPSIWLTNRLRAAAIAAGFLLACGGSGQIGPGDDDDDDDDGADAAVADDGQIIGVDGDPGGDDSGPGDPDAGPPDATEPVVRAVCADAPFTTIGSAIQASSPGDVIEICPGTYGENLVIVGKQLTLIGTGGTDATVIDGGGLAPALIVRQTDGAGVRLQGLTLRNGKTDTSGGGIRCVDSALTIAATTFTGNQARDGGGMHAAGCAVDLDGARFHGNQATYGGGLYLADGTATIRNSQFRTNQARRGGGAYLSNDAVVEDSVFAENTADWTGGGVYVFEHAPIFRRNTISANYSFNDGGGMYFHWGTPTLIENHVVGNRSDDDGGGIRLFTSMAVVERNIIENNESGDGGGGIRISHLPCQLTDNIIRGNKAGSGGGIDLDNDSSVIRGGSITNNQAGRGGGVHLVLWPWSGGLLENITISNNRGWRGGGMFIEENFQPVTLRNLRLLDNEADHGGAIYERGSNFTLTNSVIAGNHADDDGGAIASHVTDKWWDPCPCPPTNTTGRIDFSVIYRNTTDGVGSVVWKDSKHALIIQNSILLDNGGTNPNTSTVEVVAAEPTEEDPFPPIVPPVWRYNDTAPAGLFVGMADPTGSNGNLTANPMFANSANGNYHLLSGSPCIDAGDPAVLDLDMSRADMGLFGGPLAP